MPQKIYKKLNEAAIDQKFFRKKKEKEGAQALSGDENIILEEPPLKTDDDLNDDQGDKAERRKQTEALKKRIDFFLATPFEGEYEVGRAVADAKKRPKDVVEWSG